MRLTWKDGATTLLAAVVVGILAAHTANWSVPFVENARWAALLIGGIGLLMCIVGGSEAAIVARSTYTVVAGTLGGVALLLVIAGVVTGSSLAVTLVAVDTIVLWLVSTIRHAVGVHPRQTGMRLGGRA
ncbi:MAG TPA: hypothetical protein VL687_05910 [Methylomirabilota bacterium]|nr:hypothetical protein [Methylomirabilota bacterium]